jgi:hypothetical protein
VHCWRPSLDAADGVFEIFGAVADAGGNRVVRDSIRGNDAEELGFLIAGLLLSKGARKLLAEIGTD